MLNADEDAERDEWMKAITEVLEKAAQKPPKLKTDATAVRGSASAPTPGGIGGMGKSQRLPAGSEWNPSQAATLHSGWMSKKGEGMLAKSQSRWFVLLDDKNMHYFEDEDCTSHKGVVQLQSLTKGDFKRVKPKSSDYSFQLATPGRKWVLNPGTEAAYETWEQKLLDIAA